MASDTTSSATAAARKQSAQEALAARRRRREAASASEAAASASVVSTGAAGGQSGTNAGPTRAGRPAAAAAASSSGAGAVAPPRPDIVGSSARPPSAARGIGSAIRSTPPASVMGAAASRPSASNAPSSSSSPMSTVKNLLSSLNVDLTDATVGAGSASENTSGGESYGDDTYRIRRVDMSQPSRPGTGNRRTSHPNADNAAAAIGNDGDDNDDSVDLSTWSDCGDRVDGDDGGRGTEEQGPHDAMAALRQSDFGTLRPTEPDRLDATCLMYDSSVVVRIINYDVGVASVSAVDGVASNNNNNNSGQQTQSRYCTAAVVVDGTGTGAGEQVLTLRRAHDVAPSADDTGAVRYGDLISLQSSHAQNRSLGVRKAKQILGDDGSDIIDGGDQVGFYRTVRGQAERWEVLPSRGDGSYVQVGPDVALSSASAATSSAKGRTSLRRRLVRSGDPAFSGRS